ncbi:MAG TPA: hypothetical protein PKK15_16030 [Kouleothrix sp.]|uniref:hypothetical protein n=1 Tax=Kouleothrix sp. TaxID=2779161 RepID=UPI002C3D72CF|nr:hypothetical protein [Kouleothrix sp.]
MAAQTFGASVAQHDPARLLRRTLFADALFSTLGGAGMLLAAGPIAAWLGLGAGWPIALIGLDVLILGVWIGYEARRTPIAAGRVRLMLALNIAWVVASVLLLLFDPFGLTTAGKWAVAGLADAAAVVALLEYLGLRRLSRA